MTSIAPETARRVFRGAEPIHGMIYFTPFGAEACRTGLYTPSNGLLRFAVCAHGRSSG